MFLIIVCCGYSKYEKYDEMQKKLRTVCYLLCEVGLLLFGISSIETSMSAMYLFDILFFVLRLKDK